jgi:hypothetical protein
MSNANPSRPGQNQLTGAADALFQTIFTGEILTAFEMAVKFRDTIRTRTVIGQKAAEFAATFKAKARYHVPGSEINGQNIAHTNVTVSIDDLLIADTFVAKIDELKNHYDVRGPYATELGNALALFYDRQVMQSIIASARGGALFVGDQGGTVLQETDIGVAADFVTSASDLFAVLNLAKQRLDEKDVPVDTMQVFAGLKPAQWYLLANSDKNLDKDYDGQGSVGVQGLKTVSDIVIRKSNAPLFGLDVQPYNVSTKPAGLVGHPTHVDGLPVEYPTKYHADLSNTVGAVWVEPAAAMLQLAGLEIESEWDIRRQGTLMVAKMAIGSDKLRTKCAVEIKRTP